MEGEMSACREPCGEHAALSIKKEIVSMDGENMNGEHNNSGVKDGKRKVHCIVSLNKDETVSLKFIHL